MPSQQNTGFRETREFLLLPRTCLQPCRAYPESVDQHTKKEDERTSCSLTWLCMSTSSDTHFFVSLVVVPKEKCRTERCNHSPVTLIHLSLSCSFSYQYSFSCFNHTLLHSLLLCISCQMTSTGLWLHISLAHRYRCLVLCWA